MQGQRTNRNKFKRTEIIQSMLSKHSGIKLESITEGTLGNLQ